MARITDSELVLILTISPVLRSARATVAATVAISMSARLALPRPRAWGSPAPRYDASDRAAADPLGAGEQFRLRRPAGAAFMACAHEEITQ